MIESIAYGEETKKKIIIRKKSYCFVMGAGISNEASNTSHISWDRRQYILEVSSFIGKVGSNIHMYILVT
jgi:hypothetical protein